MMAKGSLKQDPGVNAMEAGGRADTRARNSRFRCYRCRQAGHLKRDCKAPANSLPRVDPRPATDGSTRRGRREPSGREAGRREYPRGRNEGTVKKPEAQRRSGEQKKKPPLRSNKELKAMIGALQAQLEPEASTKTEEYEREGDREPENY